MATNAMTALLNKEFLEQILVDSIRFYKKTEIVRYDEQLFRRLDSSINELSIISTQYKDCDIEHSTYLMALVCVEEMLNLREKLLKLKVEGSVDENNNNVGNNEKLNEQLIDPSLGKSLELISLASKCRALLANFQMNDLNIDNQSACDLCIYCSKNHLPELCTDLSVSERIRHLHASKHCSRCLASIAHSSDHRCLHTCTRCSALHHVSICAHEQSSNDKNKSIQPISNSFKLKSIIDLCCINSNTARANLDYIVEQPPHEEHSIAHTIDFLLTVPSPVVHPKSIMAMLVLRAADQDTVTYVPNITVRAHSKAKSFLARAHLNVITCSVSFVSPRLVSKLRIVPTQISPIAVEQIFGYSLMVDSFVELELSSLYKTYRYKRVFYLLDITCLRVALASPEVKKLAKERFIALSSELWQGASNLDLIIGTDQYELTGLEFGKSNRTVKLTPDLVADYTHFGYILTGTDKPANKNKSKKNKKKTKDSKEKLFYSYDRHRKLI